MTRRTFFRTSALAAAAAQCGSFTASAAPAGWEIGCFNRPWTKWSYDTTLDAIAEAGYKLTGLLSTHPGEAFTYPEATPDYLRKLKDRIGGRGLRANMTALRFRPEAPLEKKIADVTAQIENAARLELQFLLTFGVDRPEHYDDFYRQMADAAPRAEKHGLRLVLKPHGGGSGAAAEILRCLEKVGHANFKVWYDAGNIIYYTGKDPLAELDPIVRYVTGFCAKDCPGPKGEVMSQFGTGKVDFAAVFARLKAAGFKGPLMVEGVKVDSTPAETTANARANREFLERAIASL